MEALIHPDTSMKPKKEEYQMRISKKSRSSIEGLLYSASISMKQTFMGVLCGFQHRSEMNLADNYGLSPGFPKTFSQTVCH